MKLKRYMLMVAGLILSSTQVNSAEIMVIQSYHSEYAWDKAYVKAIKDKLGSKHNLTFFQMDTKRVSKSKFQDKANAAWAKYRKTNPDYVMMGDDNALKFLGNKFAKVKTPVVFLGVNNNPRSYFDNKVLPKNFTGVLERPLMKRSIAEIAGIMPKAKKVLILFDNGTTSQASMDTEVRQTKKIRNLAIDVKLVGKQEEWHKVVKTAKANGYDAIIVGLYHTIKNSAGKHIPASEILQWTNENSEVPLFGFWTFSVGKGKTTGGLLLDGYEQGLAASHLMNKVISGAIPNTFVGDKGRLTFSKTELDRWGLKLPEQIASKAKLVK